MRILISETTKHVLDKLGGFRCDYRGILDIEVSFILRQRNGMLFIKIKIKIFQLIEFYIPINTYESYSIGKAMPNGDILVDWKRQKHGGKQPRHVIKVKVLL